MSQSATQTQLDIVPRRRSSWRLRPSEFKALALRECSVDDSLADTPEKIVKFWRDHIETAQWFQSDREQAVAVMLNTRRRVIGFNLISVGTQDTVMVHPREVFRLAVIAAASAIVLCHNHPSGDPTPSMSDVMMTRSLIEAGQLMQMELLDHVILGRKCQALSEDFVSLRALGYCAIDLPRRRRRQVVAQATKNPAPDE